MKKLKPSHREKKRYILLEGEDLRKELIEGIILEYVGILGFAKASPLIIKKEKKGECILAINRSELDKIRSSFFMSNKKIKIKRVSGAIGNLK